MPWFRRQDPRPPNTLAQGTKVRGDLESPLGFAVDGHLAGSVRSSGPITIGLSGKVEGDVTGTDVTVLGTVEGNVVASGHLEIGEKGRVIGDASMKSLRVLAGGVFRGASRMGTEADVKVRALPEDTSTPDTKRPRTLAPPGGKAMPPPPQLPSAEATTPFRLTDQGLVPASAANGVAALVSQKRLVVGGSDRAPASDPYEDIEDVAMDGTDGGK
jgi:cytoskeletal protein CcmA (bactofilin family)